MNKYIRFIRENYQVLIVIVSSALLRLISLGYSDFQGDEIKALYLPEPGQTFANYLLDQRKGPVQFIITYLFKFVFPDYSNRFLIRLPFALAGIMSVYFFYKFIRLHYGKKVALYASLFFSTNGFFIAFSRIVQYQSFVILFMILSLFCLTLAVRDLRYRISGVYLGLIFWSLSILSHYDGVFIAPFVFYLLYKWFFVINSIDKKIKIKHFLIAGIISSALLLSFYIPFINTISEGTKDYWAGRISGDVSTKISSSKYLFSVYQPIYVIHFYTFLAVIGFTFLLIKFLPKLLAFVGERFAVRIINRYFPFMSSGLNKLLKSTFSRYILKDIALVIWLLLPLAFFEIFVYIPGTHIYTYLIPLFIFLGFGVNALHYMLFTFVSSRIKYPLLVIGLSVFYGFLFLQSYAVFVDHTVEYPWQEEKFMIWTFPRPTPIFHLSMFGFPYYRNWEGVESFVKAHPEYDAYSTNERKSIARYHIDLPKDSNKAGFYVYIKYPQSFENDIINEKPAYWAENYPPDYTYTKNGEALTRVYIMAPGTLEEIQEEGL